MLSIGIDLGGTKILIGLINDDGKIIHSLKKRTPASKRIDDIMNLTFETIDSAIADAGVDMKEISGIGVAAPGIVDEKNGVLLYAPNWNLRNIPVKRLLKDKFSIPVKVANDVNAAAIGELHFGHGKNENSFFWITISTGIGGALVVNGNLLLGNRGLAGEIGHMIIDDNGPDCTCGRKGCLEALASGTAIANLARKRISEGRKFLKINSEIKPEEITAETVVRAASNNDKEAFSLLKEVSGHISKALSYVVNLADIDLLVIGGGVMVNNEILFKLIEENLKHYVYEYQHRNIRLVSPQLGYNSSLIGAGALILKSKSL
ncbi:MAG: hypothetical protein A2043_05175 [Candidatus Schekmanbacteria bacterium GWA2_38_9]|uniref:Glucokinase n=1 Tax=Candidatus Schekmanbacteria bacterium RIFCSPLOWO2_12_FULL_38_15 TaxID=1817883 RepID=A0A1F7SHM8_9BACT|nr:MAG: hypothetical protein A2043_05175 [Candidatus Schekmanbacteria bacterium GWA2_38_9]OGL51329.1 MAG: hypothetical protein A3H37_00245 [Candidatus Schekmanbacteria bacterium RIFCSPLOWO2_02_FULL_38_14]OGL53292.1 MAG: hypothetical protein A3G31_07215 [Candidatus Schekmanbacteria bacterium RIFCSPLOWO2_12_FULL_38_15]